MKRKMPEIAEMIIEQVEVGVGTDMYSAETGAEHRVDRDLKNYASDKLQEIKC